MLLGQRQQYEAKLGHFIAQHPLALGCAQAMIGKGWRYICLRAAKRSGQADEIDRLLRLCSRPLDDQFAGRLGDCPQRLRRVFRGQGNLRELMAHTWLFVNNLLCPDLVGATRLPEAIDIAAEAGFDVAEIEAMIRAALRCKVDLKADDALLTIDSLISKDDFVKMPWHPIRQQQEHTRRPHPQADPHLAWSMMPRNEFEAEGGVFSSMEKALRNGLNPKYVPWLDAGRLWLPNEEHPFIQEAYEANIPLLTGLSGVTLQFMQFGRMLGVGPAVDVRLACLGYLLSTKAHSFYEIMVAAAPFGCDYRWDGTYRGIAPLDDADIEAGCGRWPD